MIFKFARLSCLCPLPSLAPVPYSYNQGVLSLDFLELLERFIPSEHEVKLIQSYERDGRPLEELSEEDRFMLRFGKIPRLAQRISTLTFMGNFPDSVQLLQPVWLLKLSPNYSYCP